LKRAREKNSARTSDNEQLNVRYRTAITVFASLKRTSRVERSFESPPANLHTSGPGQQPAQDKGPILSYSILIVDDTPLIRRALRACLEENHKDWKVCGEAADGTAALDMAQELKPDLIVLDLSMPGMNGFELASKLKDSSPSLPLLMFASFKTPQLEREAMAAGCNAVVSKSEHQQMLLDNIQRLLAPAGSYQDEDSRSTA
jgi:CheY-like chemotaxis protein